MQPRHSSTWSKRVAVVSCIVAVIVTPPAGVLSSPETTLYRAQLGSSSISFPKQLDIELRNSIQEANSSRNI